MMRAMRVIHKPLFVVVAVTFIGWLAYGQVTDILGGGRDVVLKVNGQIVRATQFQLALQNAIEESRRRGGGRLSREDEQQLQDQVTDQFIQRILLEREYRRLGIQVSDDEIRQMARSTPPPQILRQIMEDPTFQTNRQFDITKWQRYLGSASEEFRTQIEQLYREYLPERKLEEYLTVDVYVSDAKLWRIWRDQHESVTVALLAIRPELIPDSLAPVSDAELERYYAAHKDKFKRPATAWLSFVAQPKVPDAADTAAALARARRLRAEIARGATKFEDVAKKESVDSVSGARGGDLGWVKRNEGGFDPQFLAALRRLTPGELGQPALSSFGYHLIRVDADQMIAEADRKSTRLNSSHSQISYAVFCLKKKKQDAELHTGTICRQRMSACGFSSRRPRSILSIYLLHPASTLMSVMRPTSSRCRHVKSDN